MTVLAASLKNYGFGFNEPQILCDVRGLGRESEIITEKCRLSKEYFSSTFSRYWTNPQVKFDAYRQQWEEETELSSSPIEMAIHPAYQKIIGMGKPALPLILHELKTRPTHWFWALKAIAEVDPVPPEHRGRVRLMAQDWINWGRSNGYIV